ncbi:MAG TPA: neuraminidase-like domain-containing protein [Parafilimonas sp.]|nr:neuraminidase-like domain-containing protein [Parafilimonas sp.]
MASEQSSVNEIITAQIPSWNQMFGQQSQCECNECESMTGAPHYLAYLLHFLENCGVNENLVKDDPLGSGKKTGETPYDILIKRAPYLPHLQLTCENNNEEMSYSRIVLDIIEYYGANNTLENIPAYDSGNESWKNDQQETAKKAYGILSTQCFPLSLPYHQPLDIIRTYLLKLKTSRAELLKTFLQKDNANYQLQLTKESLLLCEEEYLLLTQFAIAGIQTEVFQLYGFDNLNEFKAGIYGVPVFLERTGLQYIELIDLLQTKFINQYIVAVNFLEQLFQGGDTDRSLLFSKLTQIKETPVDDNFETTLKIIIHDLLAQSTVPLPDEKAFKGWLDENLAGVEETIIIIPDVSDVCNYGLAKLGTIKSATDETIDLNLSEDTFKRLYFFIKLQRKTGLAIRELDTLLSAQNTASNDILITTLSASLQLMQNYQWTADEAVCLFGNFTSGDNRSAYSNLFLTDSLEAINKDFKADAFGNYFINPVTLKDNTGYNSVLLTALNLIPSGADILTKHLGIKEGEKFNLSIDLICVLHSHTIFAKALSISIDELVKLLESFEKPNALRSWDADANKFTSLDLAQTFSFIDYVKLVKESGFNVDEIQFITGQKTSSNVSDSITDDMIRQSLLAIKKGISDIDIENTVLPKSQVNEELVKNKLLLYNKDIVAQLTGILNNRIVYASTITEKPELAIPDILKTKMKYDPVTGRIVVNGVLSLTEWNEIIKDNELKKAVQAIFDKPRDFLTDNFSGFIKDEAARNILLDRTDNGTTTFENKLFLFFSAYQPYLVKELKKNLVIQQMATLIGLEEKIFRVISKTSIENVVLLVTEISNEISVELNSFPAVQVDDFKKTVIEFYKSSLLINKLKLNVTEVSFFLDHAIDFSGIDFNHFNAAQWQQLVGYARVRTINRSGQLSILDLFRTAGMPGVTLPYTISYISLMMGWLEEDVAGVISANKLQVSNFKNEKALLLVSEMMQLALKTGLKATQLLSWANSSMDFNSLSATAGEIKHALLQQYALSERKDAADKIDAAIWENERNALVSYLLTLKNIRSAGVRNIEELCGYFLIDLPMSSNMPTTRIRQAVSTVQSFVKRCLMGLESAKDKNTLKEVGVLPEYIGDNWEAMSFFRTWQVTMEFLINPYPYLSYKYLIDKSEAAKKLEENILKNDITSSNLEEFYRVYLQDNVKIANMEIVCCYVDDRLNSDSDAAKKFIHVIGRTRSAPHEYYYCTKSEKDRWSFWKKITVAIKENDGGAIAPKGAHVIFAKHRNRNYIFLPEFNKRASSNPKSSDGSTTLNAMAAQPASGLKPSEFWEVVIGVSEYYNGKWSEKKYPILNLSHTALYEHITADVGNYFFTLDQTDNELTLSLTIRGSKQLNFTFTSFNAAIMVTSPPSEPPVNQQHFFQNYRLKNMDFQIPETQTDVPILQEAASEKFINFSPQYSMDFMTGYNQPFFFHDKDRSYYVNTEPSTYAVEKTIPDTPGIIKRQLPRQETLMVIRSPESQYFYPMRFD